MMTHSVYMLLSAGVWTPGTMEIAIFAAIVLIFFGPKRLPQLSRAIGRSITDFKRGLHDMHRDIEDADDEDEDDLEDDASRRRLSGRKSERVAGKPVASQREEQKVQATASSPAGDSTAADTPRQPED